MEVMNETIKTLTTRRSMRKFKKEQILEKELEQILAAAVNAPSGRNTQPAKIVVVQDEATIERLRKLHQKVLGNDTIDALYGAPTVVVVLADPEVNATWHDDGVLVLGNMVNAAYSLGIGSCYIYRAMPIFDMPEGKELLREWGIPERFRGIGHCILGYPDGEERPITHKEDYIVRV